MKRPLSFVLLFAMFPALQVLALTGNDLQQKRQAAMGLFEQGKYGEAAPLLEEVLAADPADKTTLRYLLLYRRRTVEPYCRQAADAYLIGNHPEAIRLWQEVLKLNPSDRQVSELIEDAIDASNETAAKSIYAAAESSMREGRYDEAVRELEKILEILSGDKQASSMLQTAQRSIVDNAVKELYGNADAFLHDGLYDQAIGQWVQILKMDPKQELASRFIASTRRAKLDAFYGRAFLLYNAGDYVSSRDVYQNIMADNPTDPTIKKTIDKLSKVIAIIPQVGEEGTAWDMVRKGLSNYISEEGDAKVALVASWHAFQLKPESMRVQAVKNFLESELHDTFQNLEAPVTGMGIIDQYLFAALNHIYEGRYDLAVQKCGIVIELEPDNVLALKRMGSAFFAIGRKEKAKETWVRALNLSPNDKELREYVNQVR